MDQTKIGNFIATLRKEKSYTQLELADILGISDKTISKWERGIGIPDVSLMLPLCEVLKITVNELLTGERLTDISYKEKAEDNIMDLIKEKQESKKKIIIAIISCLMGLISAITMFMVASYVVMEKWIQIVLIIVGLVVLFTSATLACLLEWNAGTYECQKCKHRFVPKAGAYIMGLHTFTKRYLKCPNCGEKSICKRKLTH
jgi:transcriptional regulator with XRE-family HTH domain/DNA-directed RNA polymerase subunit RPC12/RpoP